MGFRTSTDYMVANGTSLVGSVQLVYSDIVEAFGDPLKGDGYKVSGEWIFVDDESGAVFTLYDWKSTSLYSEDLPSVEAFRANFKPQKFNVGSNRVMLTSDFTEWLIEQINKKKSN